MKLRYSDKEMFELALSDEVPAGVNRWAMRVLLARTGMAWEDMRAMTPSEIIDLFNKLEAPC